MSEIHIGGFRRLQGRIPVQGSKNGVLPIMAASILTDETTVITNVPAIQDVFCMMGILKFMGCGCTLKDGELTVRPGGLNRTDLPECHVSRMRSSIVLLGAVLGRLGSAATCYPGGCSIGKRPIDFHLQALRALGAEIREDGCRIQARATRLRGAGIHFPYPSVGATENALLAAVLAEGETVIQGAAREPEIEELCRFLNAMGAETAGGGTDVITVQGRKRLHGCRFAVSGDRIVAGTYLMAAMAGRGRCGAGRGKALPPEGGAAGSGGGGSRPQNFRKFRGCDHERASQPHFRENRSLSRFSHGSAVPSHGASLQRFRRQPDPGNSF